MQAKKHKIGTYKIDKISLSCFNDKRFVLDDGVSTLVYFHKDCCKKECDKNKKKIIRMKKRMRMRIRMRMSSIDIDRSRQFVINIIIFL